MNIYINMFLALLSAANVFLATNNLNYAAAVFCGLTVLVDRK